MIDMNLEDTKAPRPDHEEEFSVVFNSKENKVTLKVNGVTRTYIKSKDAENIFEKLLKIAKYKFIKMRERFNPN